MDDPVARELEKLEDEERRLRQMRSVGLVSDWAYQLRLHQLQERRQQLRQGLAWAQERAGLARLK